MGTCCVVRSYKSLHNIVEEYFMMDFGNLLKDYQQLLDVYENENLTRRERERLKSQLASIGDAIENLAGIKT